MLTDTWLKARQGCARPETEEESDRDGLSVRLTRTGKIVFQMRYRFVGQPRRLDLGSYPALSLKNARDENERLREFLEKGQDPRVVRRCEQHSVQTEQVDTLTVLFLDYFLKRLSPLVNRPDQYLRTFEIHMLPRFGELPARQVSLHHWMDLLEELAASLPAVAERVLSVADSVIAM